MVETQTDPAWSKAFTSILNPRKREKRKRTEEEEVTEEATEEVNKETQEEPKVKGKPKPAKQSVKSEVDPSRKLRSKPSYMETESEKRLRAIATKGAVQLFNAVKQHQLGKKPIV